MASESDTPGDPIASDLIRDDTSFADIVIQFVEGLSGRLETMDKALGSSNFEALRTAAHQLKGSGGGYGYPVLSERAAMLEKHAKMRVIEDCQRALDELKSICGRVVIGTGWQDGD